MPPTVWIPDMDEEIPIPPYRRWLWVLLGVIVSIICLWLYESNYTVLSDLHVRYIRMNRLYMDGLLFDYKAILYRE